MLCFFCDSNLHLSQHCKKRSSNKSRIKIAVEKKHCYFCFTLTDDLRQHDRDYCEIYRKCYTCFTVAHHTFLCLNRKTVLKFFIPNINVDLFCRFFYMFDLLEQYTYAFACLETHKFIHLKHLTIIHKKEISKNYVSTEFSDSTLLINGMITVSKVKRDQSVFTNFICKAPFVTVKGSKICKNDFFRLLSSETTFLDCEFLTVKGEITFAEMLQKIPNILNLKLHKTNIKIGNTWPKYLYDIRSKLKLEMLRIDISDINFDDEVLANVLKLTNLEIHLKLDIPFDTQGNIHNKNTLKILTKFSKLFVPCERKMSILSISVGNGAPNCFSLR